MNRHLLLVPLLLLAACAAPPPPQAQGVIEAQEETLSFPVAGRITAVAVAEGQRIAADAELATVDGDAERLAVAQAAAEVALQSAALDQAKAAARPELLSAARARAEAARRTAELATAEQQRQQQLLAEHAASQQGLDDAARAAATASAEATATTETVHQLEAGADAPALAVAQAQLALARSALATAQDRLAKTVLHAPPGARVVRHILRRPGEQVLAGTPVVTVADLDHPYIDAFLPQAQAAALHPGDPAQVHCDGVPPLSGTVERVGERLEYTPRFLFGPEDRPNLMIRVRVRVAGQAPAAGVPADVRFTAAP